MATPSLVLLDLNLPGCSGLEILESIRENSALDRTPVAILTSTAAEKDRMLAREGGAD